METTNDQNNFLIFRFTIRIGDLNLANVNPERLEIKRIHKHPKYDGTKAHFDVAILETEELEFSRFKLPVCLPVTKFISEDEYDNRHFELIGWGSKSTTGQTSKTLKRVSINVFPLR